MFADLEHDAYLARETDAAWQQAEYARLEAEFRSQRLDALPRGIGFRDIEERRKREMPLLAQINRRVAQCDAKRETARTALEAVA